MERIKALIDKLHQQKEQGFTPAQLLPTVQLLQSELMQYQQKTTSLGTSKVAVMMPAQLHPTQLHNAEELTAPAALVEDKKPKFQAREILNENIQPETNPPVAEPVKEPEYFLHRPLVE